MDQQRFVGSMIRSYYKSRGELRIGKINEREFGFGTFDKKISHRHMHIKDADHLKKILVEEAPAYVSCSSAYYKYPDARPMERKIWQGSDLVFDLDATDMHLKCDPEHSREWVCKNCFSKVREEALKLVEDFLIPDFGFSEKEIAINFSGNRGYHVRINREDVLPLDANARKEISDYISANGLDFVKMFPTSEHRGVLRGPKLSDKGWNGKIARNFVNTLAQGPDALIGEFGIEKSVAKTLYSKRSLVEMGIKSGNWDMVYIKKKSEFWKDVVGKQSIAQSDRIDKNVTVDPTHLIRVPDTIHGSTGLIAKRISSISELADYDPMTRCIAFKKGELKVLLENVPKFEMNGEVFGPFQKQETSLPVYAGLYIFLKGKCQILKYSS